MVKMMTFERGDFFLLLFMLFSSQAQPCSHQVTGTCVVIMWLGLPEMGSVHRCALMVHGQYILENWFLGKSFFAIK